MNAAKVGSFSLPTRFSELKKHKEKGLERIFVSVLAEFIANSFMNDIANLCELVGADADMVRRGIGSDARIGTKFLYPGCGYGGSCFPKDVKALIHTGKEYGYDMRVIESVEEVNESQKSVVFEKLLKAFDGKLEGKTIALWGLAFKPETDDMREAPALVVINKLIKAGAKVNVYDPVAMNECKRRIGDVVTYCEDMYEGIAYIHSSPPDHKHSPSHPLLSTYL